MPYGMPPSEDDPIQPMSTYPGNLPMDQLANFAPPPQQSLTNVPTPDAPGRRMPINAGGIAGLAGLIGAAIAGPKSNIGNLLHGGVTAYANDTMRKQLEKQRSDSEQHENLVKVVMSKVPELSRMAPDAPGVKELQKMWAEALADDNVISPKEAADMSAKIHSIEGGISDYSKKKDAEEKRAEARASSQEQSDQKAWALMQATTPSLQGMSFEDARKQTWFRKLADQANSTQMQRELEIQKNKDQTIPTRVGGQDVNLPATAVYEQEQAGQRARTAAAGMQNRITTQGDIRGSQMEKMEQIKAAMAILQDARKSPGKYKRDPQLMAQVRQAQDFMNNLDHPEGGPIPPQGGGPRSPMTPPPGGPTSFRVPPVSMEIQAQPAGGGKPLPPNVDPAQLSPEQKARLRAAGYAI